MSERVFSADAKTPTINRILFGIITLIFVSSMLKVVYLYYLGADTPPYPFWIIFYGFPMLGFILTPFRGEIRFRLHKIWTPVRLGMIAYSWYTVIFLDFQSGILNTILVNSSELILYVNALGLLLAFVDLNVLYKYAYLFAPTLIFTILGVIHDDSSLLSNFYLWGDGLIDQFWFASGILFAYYGAKKFRTERPPLRRSLLFTGASIGIVVLLIATGQVIAYFLPANSWGANWLTARKPAVNLTCVGNGCSLPLYSNIYSTNSTLCLRSDSTFRTGIQPFSLVAQDHALLSCRFLMNTDTSILTVSCGHSISPAVGNAMNFTMLQCHG